MRKILLIIVVILNVHLVSGALQVTELRCCHQVNPMSVDVQNPALSWKLVSDSRNVLQTAYQIEVFSGKTRVWNSGKVLSSTSVNIPYSGLHLRSGERYEWRVKVWDNQGNVSAWSSPAFWQMGILNPAEWQAKCISAGPNSDSTVYEPCPLFRKEFTLKKQIKRATLYASAPGLYKAYLNGKPVTNAMFTPGWTSYPNRIQYQAHDVTHFLETKNTLGAIVAKGWYSGRIGWQGYCNFYGNENGVFLQLNIEFNDGTKQIITTDESWKTSTGTIRYADIYDGECIDARINKQDWLTFGFSDKDWQKATTINFPVEKLAAQNAPFVKKQEVLYPKSIVRKSNDVFIVDFGQNFSGIVNLKLNGEAGDSVIVTHAEVLDKAGEFYTGNLRTALQKDVFILSGNGIDTFEPAFTFHGFRYVKIENYKGELSEGDIKAFALYSDIKNTGNFSCSDSLLNQLQHNIQWGQKSNFLDIPTDCPQRDERLGWTGDAQVFSRTAMFNADCYTFFSKWLADLQAEQQSDGAVPFFVPRLKTPTEFSAAGWADAATIIPWNMFLVYGDTTILRKQYESMKGWVIYMKNKSVNYLWNTNWHYGDWLFYSPEDDLYGDAAITNKHFIAQCFFAHSTHLLINAATVLGNNADVAVYSELLTNIKKAFLHEYVTPGGRLISETQTAYTLVLQFDMLPENMRPLIANRLVENIQYYNNHLTTGFLGTPYLMHVLSRFGKNETAFQLLMQKTYPSWLYPITKGATTIWERWDGIKPDGSFQNEEMNSFNHYAYGAIGDWLYRVVAGINQDAENPGYKHVILKPQPGGGLTHAKASLETVYGKIISDWKIEKGEFHYKVEIPANTTATVVLPTGFGKKISESGLQLENIGDVDFDEDREQIKMKIGSGKYDFRITE